MAFGFDLVKHAVNLPIGADDKCRAFDAHHFVAIHVLFFHHSEGIADFFVHVRQKRVGQVVLLLKFLLPGWRIGGNPKDDRPGFLQLLVCVAEPARFDSSTGRIGLGEEEQHHGFAAKVLQRHLLSVLVR